MEIIARELEARERAAIGNSAKPPSRIPPTATALMTRGASTMVSCSYCRQLHSSNSCPVVTNITERKQVLKTSGRCFVCIKKHHISRDCRSTLKCSKCNGRHHFSICRGEPSRPATNSQPSTTNMSLSGSGSLSDQPTTQSSTSTKNTPTTMVQLDLNLMLASTVPAFKIARITCAQP